jgi:outer membrane murein-binding lipoprotein Lpp
MTSADKFAVGAVMVAMLYVAGHVIYAVVMGRF